MGSGLTGSAEKKSLHGLVIQYRTTHACTNSPNKNYTDILAGHWLFNLDTDVMMLSARLNDQQPYMEKNGKEIMRTGLSFIQRSIDLADASLKSLHTLLNDTGSKHGTMIKKRHIRIRIWKTVHLSDLGHCLLPPFKLLKNYMEPKLSAKGSHQVKEKNYIIYKSCA